MKFGQTCISVICIHVSINTMDRYGKVQRANIVSLLFLIFSMWDLLVMPYPKTPVYTYNYSLKILSTSISINTFLYQLRTTPDRLLSIKFPLVTHQSGLLVWRGRQIYNTNIETNKYFFILLVRYYK
jgi:hypothetical protein